MERLAHLAQSTSHDTKITVISRTIPVPRAGQRTGGVGTVNGSAVDVTRTSRATLSSIWTHLGTGDPLPLVLDRGLGEKRTAKWRIGQICNSAMRYNSLNMRKRLESVSIAVSESKSELIDSIV